MNLGKNICKQFREYFIISKLHLGEKLLFQKKGELTLEVYTDTDYARSPVDRRSMTGYYMFLSDMEE